MNCALDSSTVHNNCPTRTNQVWPLITRLKLHSHQGVSGCKPWIHRECQVTCPLVELTLVATDHENPSQRALLPIFMQTFENCNILLNSKLGLHHKNHLSSNGNLAQIQVEGVLQSGMSQLPHMSQMKTCQSSEIVTHLSFHFGSI